MEDVIHTIVAQESELDKPKAQLAKVDEEFDTVRPLVRCDSFLDPQGGFACLVSSPGS